jgi:hypothetical protein
MKKLLLYLFICTGFVANAQSTIFAENWDGVGPGYSAWTLYNVDGLTPVGPDGVDGEPLSFLVQNAWSLLSLTDIQGANPAFTGYPAAATGMAGNVVASNSWYAPIGTANDWIVSPLITIPAGATNLNLSWAATSLGSTSFLEDYRVHISPTGGSQISNFTVLLADVNNELSAGNYRTLPLANYAGQSIRIAFQNDGIDQYVMFLDNISITGTLLSNDEFLSNKFSTYPNPAKNEINVLNNESISISSISITDLNGRIINTTEYNGVSSATINVADLSTGIYFLNINSEEGKAVKKFVKN